MFCIFTIPYSVLVYVLHKSHVSYLYQSVDISDNMSLCTIRPDKYDGQVCSKLEIDDTTDNSGFGIDSLGPSDAE